MVPSFLCFRGIGGWSLGSVFLVGEISMMVVTCFPLSLPRGLADDLTWLLGFAGVDYCLLSDHGCEYSCVNTDRSFSCQCPDGHVLRSDGKTCTSECSEVWQQVGLAADGWWVGCTGRQVPHCESTREFTSPWECG